MVCKLLLGAHGIEFPDQGSNLDPLHWECSLSYWTCREVPCHVFLSCFKWILFFLLLITQTVSRVSQCPGSGHGQTLERYQLGNEEGAVDRGPWRGFQEEGKLSQTPGVFGVKNGLGTRIALSAVGPRGQSGR